MAKFYSKWKDYTREEYKKANKPLDEFEQDWKKTFRLIRRFYGDAKDLNRSYLTAEYLLNWKTQNEALKGANAFEKEFTGTRKERFVADTIFRLSSLSTKYEDVAEYVKEFELGKITYDELKNKIKDFKKSNDNYLSQKDGSK